MNALYVVVAVAVVGAVTLLLWWRSQRSTKRVATKKASALKQKWRRLSQMPPAQADAALDRTLAMLEEKHPGRRRDWYLAKAVEELERSKR